MTADIPEVKNETQNNDNLSLLTEIAAILADNIGNLDRVAVITEDFMITKSKKIVDIKLDTVEWLSEDQSFLMDVDPSSAYYNLFTALKQANSAHEDRVIYEESSSLLPRIGILYRDVNDAI